MDNMKEELNKGRNAEEKLIWNVGNKNCSEWNSVLWEVSRRQTMWVWEHTEEIRQSHKQVAVGIPIYTSHCVVGIEEDSCSKGITFSKG